MKHFRSSDHRDAERLLVDTGLAGKARAPKLETDRILVGDCIEMMNNTLNAMERFHRNDEQPAGRQCRSDLCRSAL